MAWEVTETDFSVFKTDAGKHLYCKGVQNKLILLPYAHTDLVSVCMLAKKGTMILQSCPFIPTYVRYYSGEFCAIKTLAADLIRSFGDEEIAKMRESELRPLKLIKYQIPQDIWIEWCCNNRESQRYLDLGLGREDAIFFMVRKNKVSQLLDYLKFLDEYGITLTAQADIADIKQLNSDFDDSLYAKTICKIDELVKSDRHAFCLAFQCSFDRQQTDHMKYQLQWIEKMYGQLLEIESRINPMLKSVAFYYGPKYLGEPEVETRYRIDLLRSRLLSSLSDGSYLYYALLFMDGFYFRDGVPCIATNIAEEKEAVLEVWENIKKYLDNFTKRHAHYAQASQIIFDIYSDQVPTK